MKERILFVDDDANLLDGMSRKFRKKLNMDTAVGPEAALEKVSKDPSFAVVVSDFKMPGMDGVVLLNTVKERMPDASRILLTGYAEVNIAMKAVNEGAIFRFLSKPCPDELLLDAIQAGIHHHHLMRTERDLLSVTLVSSLRMLIESVGHLSQADIRRIARVREHVLALSKSLEIDDTWTFEVAAMLSAVLYRFLPQELLTRITDGAVLSPEDQLIISQHTNYCGDLVRTFPHLSEVGDILRRQHADNSTLKDTEAKYSDHVRLGIQLLNVSHEFEALLTSGKTPQEASKILSAQQDRYDPHVLEALRHTISTQDQFVPEELPVSHLKSNMKLETDIRDPSGKILFNAKQPLTETELSHLEHLTHAQMIPDKILVRHPTSA